MDDDKRDWRERMGDLFAEPVLRARVSDPDTSQAAAASYDRDKLAGASRLAERLHRDHGPLADYEYRPLFLDAYEGKCCAHLYRQARSTARDAGRIRDSGTKKVNPETGRQQVVWEYCDGTAPEIKKCPTCGHVLRREEEIVL